MRTQVQARTRTMAATAAQSHTQSVGVGARVPLPCATYKPTALSRLLRALDELHEEGVRVRLGTQAQMARAVGAGWTGLPGGTLLAVARYTSDGRQAMYLWDGALLTEDARLMRRARLALAALDAHAIAQTADTPDAVTCVAVAVERGRYGVMLAERRPARRVVSFDITRESAREA